MVMNKQVSLTFTLGKYMTGFYVMSFSYVHMGQKVTLKPLSPREREEGKKALIASRREVKRVLLARREPIYLLPINMCFHVASLLFVFLAWFREMLESFKDLFPNGIPRSLPPIRGIEHHIDFTLGATFPNREAYRANPEESREIQQQVGKLVEKGWV
ncbi:hypothetical protein CR513_21722, partial [Mucuna pruriens]